MSYYVKIKRDKKKKNNRSCKLRTEGTCLRNYHRPITKSPNFASSTPMAYKLKKWKEINRFGFPWHTQQD